MLEHTSCVGIGGQDMMKTMAIINKINGLGPELFFLVSKGVYHEFCVVLTFFFVEHTSLGFGYVWIQYLIDFGENKIQGSQACRIVLGSMVGIYWIYALFGGSLLFGQKRMQPEHATKKKKTMDCDYLITPFCFYKAWNTYGKLGLDMFGFNIW